MFKLPIDKAVATDRTNARKTNLGNQLKVTGPFLTPIKTGKFCANIRWEIGANIIVMIGMSATLAFP